MDKQNIEAALMVGSTGLLVELEFKHRRDAVVANMRSYNRWLEDDWGFDNQGRIYTVPVISLLDLDGAIEELLHVARLGARFFYFKMGPVDGKSPSDSTFDRFWAAAADTGLHPVLHIDNHGYHSALAPVWGLPEAANMFEATPFLRYLGDIWRPIQDTIAALVLQDLYGRFPALAETLVVECGSEWLGTCLKYMDKAAKAGGGSWVSGHRATDGKTPSEVFRQHFFVSPFAEDNIPALVDVLGAEGVLFGSDWPHGEGVAQPIDYLDRLDALTTSDVRKIMRENAAGILGLPVG